MVTIYFEDVKITTVKVILLKTLEPNDKSLTYLHPATGNFSSLDLSLCHPSLLLDFDLTVSEAQHGSDHFPVIIESVNNSTNDHNAKWILNKANWELYHSLCEESLKKDKFNNSLDPLDDFTSSLLDISNKSIPKTSTNPKKSKPWYNDECKDAIKIASKHYQSSADIQQRRTRIKLRISEQIEQ